VIAASGTLESFARDVVRNGPAGLYAVTGPAGAGKSTFAAALGTATGATVYSADFRFIGDSQHRRDLLARKGAQSVEAYRDSANQFNWWDWVRIDADLRALASGEPLTLSDAYDRTSGRSQSTLALPATSRIVYDGAILGPPALLARLATVFFLCTPASVRLSRLIEKDGARRTTAEIAARFLITELSETMHYRHLFAACRDRLLFIDSATGRPCQAPKLAEDGFVPVPTKIA